MRWMGLAAALLIGCGSTEPPPPTVPLAKLPEIVEILPSLMPQEERMGIEGVPVAAARLIEQRETEGMLEHAAALLRYHWQRHADSLALNTQLAEVHVRFLDRLDPDTPEKKEKMAKHREAGRTLVREALRLDPGHGPAHYWYGHLLLHYADAERSLGKMKEAIPHLEAAERTVPDYDHHGPARMLGRIYQETPGIFGGDSKKALAYLEKAVQGSPDGMQSRLWLAEVQLDLKKFPEARQTIDFMLQALPQAGHEIGHRELQEKARQLLKKLPSEK